MLAAMNHPKDYSSTNYKWTFNPIEKIVELYEALVQSEREKAAAFRRMLDD